MCVFDFSAHIHFKMDMPLVHLIFRAQGGAAAAGADAGHAVVHPDVCITVRLELVRMLRADKRQGVIPGHLTGKLPVTEKPQPIVQLQIPDSLVVAVLLRADICLFNTGSIGTFAGFGNWIC